MVASEMKIIFQPKNSLELQLYSVNNDSLFAVTMNYTNHGQKPETMLYYRLRSDIR